MQPNDAGSVSAVPSGSAGEPTPTPTTDVDRVATWEARLRDAAGMRAYLPSYAAYKAALDGLLSAVAAAATAQTEALMCEAYDAGWYARCQDDWRDAARDTALALIREQATVRALAGGAPPAPHTPDTTEE
jgi:hypothetical protein